MPLECDECGETIEPSSQIWQIHRGAANDNAVEQVDAPLNFCFKEHMKAFVATKVQ
jgi:hypothetical protein